MTDLYINDKQQLPSGVHEDSKETEHATVFATEPPISVGGTFPTIGSEYVPEDFGNFCSKPLFISEIPLAEGTELSDSVFDPFYQYFFNSVVKEKVQHFRNWRGNLHLRFCLDLSPYQYTSVLVSFKPMISTLGSIFSVKEGEINDYSGGNISGYTINPTPFSRQMALLFERQHLRLQLLQPRLG